MSSTGTPDFQVSASPATLTLTAGQSGTVTASVTPVNSRLVDGSDVCYALLLGPSRSVFLHLYPGERRDPARRHRRAHQFNGHRDADGIHSLGQLIPVATPWPGRCCFPAYSAWAALPGEVRRRRWLNRLSLLALVGLVTMLGTTACNPRYNYEHHGPPVNPATPAGTYTISVIGQSSNGVTATTHSTTIALTVQ
jgi:hypothetical protein